MDNNDTSSEQLNRKIKELYNLRANDLIKIANQENRIKQLTQVLRDIQKELHCTNLNSQGKERALALQIYNLQKIKV